MMKLNKLLLALCIFIVAEVIFPITNVYANDNYKLTVHCINIIDDQALGDVVVYPEYAYKSGSNTYYRFTPPHFDGYYVDNQYIYIQHDPDATTDANKIDDYMYILKYRPFYSEYWSKENGKWYYKDCLGNYKTGWRNISGSWYYLDPTTKVMQTNWKQIDGTWYYFWSTGEMASSTIVDGYALDVNGALE